MLFFGIFQASLAWGQKSPTAGATRPVPVDTRNKAFRPKPGCVLIAATNDVHGALPPYTRPSADKRGSVQEGGVLALGGYVDILRRQSGGRFLLLDAGDIFQGTMVSNLSYGAAMVAAYNALGYDAAAIGNHEFDYGSGRLGAGPRGEPPAPTAVLQQRIAEAKFPFLAANIEQAADHTALAWKNVQPSLLKEVAGIRVGIVGASTPTTKEATNPRYVAALDFLTPAERVQKEAAKLRQAGAQIVVLLAHMGGRCHDAQDPFNNQSCAQRGMENELADTLASMPPNTVDVAIGGHTHQFMAHWFGHTAVLESGAQGHFFGLVEACPAAETQQEVLAGLDTARSKIYPTQALCLQTWQDGSCGQRTRATRVQAAKFGGERVRVPESLAALARPYLDAVTRQEHTPVGATLSTALSAPRLTSLIAEALRRATHADFGVQNRGGVRRGMDAGQVLYKDVFEAVPFDNFAAVATLSGRQLRALAQALVGDRPPELHPAFAGLQFVGQGAELRLMTRKGTPLDDNQRYTLCTTDFILNGGDGAGVALRDLDPKDVHVYPLTLRDALAQLLATLYPSPIAAPEPAALP